ncbi:MAG: pseudouridine synthase [Huintestinicola sp.]
MLYYMFNKPRGCVTACRDASNKTVMDYFPEAEREILRPVGRLDIDTEGLLIITDDGKFGHSLMQPEFHVEKTYFFWAFGSIDDERRKQIESGVRIVSEHMTRPARLEILEKKHVADIEEFLPENRRESYMKNPNGDVFSGYLSITEGKRHQVKLMLKAVGCKVAYLKRIAIGSVRLDPELSPGAYRPLTEEELSGLGKKIY